ncbi:MAG: hypothetical protein GXP55_10450, partial [Deltaproteobacteria bacterium]|nr:hypothetical protein [Deltaproteobacteria bacterium]
MQQRVGNWVMTCVGLSLLLAGCASGGPSGRTPVRDGGPDSGADTGTPSCTVDSDCVDDGVFCNGGFICTDGSCVETPPPSCGDGVGCTRDECLTSTDECQNTPVDTSCPSGTTCFVGVGCQVAPPCEFDSDCGGDGVFCNGEEICLAASCTSPGTRDCDDANNCTIDECVEGDAACAHTPADFLNDALNCGPTGENDCVVCADPDPAQVNMAPACVTGACGLACQDGFADADSDPANGCECALGVMDDLPEMGFEDANCDGIDGDISVAIFVAPPPLGDDAADGSMATPVATVARGIELASTRTRKEIYVAMGTYAETVSLVDGVSIYGGYDAADGWSRARDNRSEIQGGETAVRGDGLFDDLEIQLMAITAANATTPGASSYGVRVTSSTATVTLTSDTIRSGNGGPGSAGASGSGGANGTAGGRGGNGCDGCS